MSADDVSAGEGIDATLLGAVERADGTRQLTVAGWPVYRYAKDTKAGDTLGEGVGGTWHVLGPDGKPAARAGSRRPTPARAERTKRAGPTRPGRAPHSPSTRTPSSVPSSRMRRAGRFTDSTRTAPGR
ncbi:hypothetical protein WKI68_07500 [Streptomyces sp. MS1.HAVA.3]|uniref:Uncharacterized protein n=1 Tax=Streptomyces caledonius TaxID=3134107 RepID=A0ABU8U1G6_9ACTN